MTVISRAFSITYGDITVGGASSVYLIEGPITRSHSYMIESFTCMVIVTGSSRDVMLANVAALQAEISRPRRDLTVTLSGSVLPFTEATNSVSISASMSREPSRFDNSTSQVFILNFDIQKTASDAADNGLLDYNYSTSLNQNGTRAITVAAAFTQHNGSTAEAIYNTLFPGILTTIKNSVDATAEWEEGPRGVEYDRFNQTLSVTTSFMERIYGENAAGTYESALKSYSFNSMVTYLRAPGAIRDTSNATNTAVVVSAVVDSAVTQDLQAVYDITIRPKILAYMTAQGNAGGPNPPQPIQEEIVFDPVTNTISCNMLWRTYGSLVVLRSSVQVGYDFIPPAMKLPTYEPNGFARLRVPGPGSVTCSIERSITVLGDRSVALTILNTLKETPTKTSFGGSFRASGNQHISRDEYNQLGVSGGGWTLERASEIYDGPNFNDILGPQLFETSMMISEVWDYDLDPTGLNGISVTR
ncbi:MAG: hypothetical protein E6Q97_10485 [Desulfurellales bacterium]|nr:MAG: hypothetical protein E6Q97_10485 [Desulfurellales bacterium]